MKASVLESKAKQMDNVFSRDYDIICPLPSSKGHASLANTSVAQAVASSLDCFPLLVKWVARAVPMAVKSTKSPRSMRMNKNAPKLMHFCTMVLEEEARGKIEGKKVLLYDDVMTWGNTSEAARNMLLLAGAKEVDVLTVFATGPLMRAATYELVEEGKD